MSLLSTAIKTYLQKNYVFRVGELTDFDIDSGEHTIQAAVLLHGERSPVKFQANYEIVKNKKSSSLVISDIVCKRKWMQEAIDLYLDGNPFEIDLSDCPSTLVSILKKIL